MFYVFFPRKRAFSLTSSFLSLSPRHCREERAEGEGEEEQEEEAKADRKSPGAAQCLPRYRQGKPVKQETHRVDFGVFCLFVFCKSAQSYFPLSDTGAVRGVCAALTGIRSQRHCERRSPEGLLFML